MSGHRSARSTDDLFDAAPMYDEDYLHFWASETTVSDTAPAVDRTPDGDTALIWRLLELQAGTEVLDLCCGHGPLANRLAQRGCRVTGLDSSPVFLARARADAAAIGVHVDYVDGDMRDLPWSDRFDCVVNWSIAFGYFGDDANRLVLGEVARVLRPGGRMVMDLNNMTSRLVSFQTARVAVRDPGDLLVDQFRLDPLTSRLLVERTIVRGGAVCHVPFVVRLFGFPELRDWLTAAGFHRITSCGEDGAALHGDHHRMIVLAHRA